MASHDAVVRKLRAVYRDPVELAEAPGLPRRDLVTRDDVSSFRRRVRDARQRWCLGRGSSGDRVGRRPGRHRRRGPDWRRSGDGHRQSDQGPHCRAARRGQPWRTTCCTEGSSYSFARANPRARKRDGDRARLRRQQCARSRGQDEAVRGRAAVEDPAKKECSSATTAAPSPIAAPPRLTDLYRTSSTANMPRMLDSSGIVAPDRGATEKPSGRRGNRAPNSEPILVHRRLGRDRLAALLRRHSGRKGGLCRPAPILSPRIRARTIRIQECKRRFFRRKKGLSARRKSGLKGEGALLP
jgi:hypothetical protein